MLLVYAGGIAALSTDNYAALAQLLTTNVINDLDEQKPLVVNLVEKISELEGSDVFKVLPEYKQKHVPRSEYLFQTLQPTLEDMLFMGTQYEVIFDKFELMLALVYADYRKKKFTKMKSDYYHFQVPTGRFAWKFYKRRESENPFNNLKTEAENYKDNWAAIKAGFFDGSFVRFEELLGELKDFIEKLRLF